MAYIDLDGIFDTTPVCLNPHVGAEVKRLRNMAVELRTQSLVTESRFMKVMLAQESRQFRTKATEFQNARCKGRLLNGERVCDCSFGASRQSDLTVQPSQHES